MTYLTWTDDSALFQMDWEPTARRESARAYLRMRLAGHSPGQANALLRSEDASPAEAATTRCPYCGEYTVDNTLADERTRYGEPLPGTPDDSEWCPPGQTNALFRTGTICEVSECGNDATPCECGAGHCRTHPHVS